MHGTTLSPVTRISGQLSVTVQIGTDGYVRDAYCRGEQFRGYEAIMKGRKSSDAVYLTQRVCGICSMAHGYTAARLFEALHGIEPTDEALLLQQLMLGAEFLQNHIRHFYLLALPDYLPDGSVPGSTAYEMDRLSPGQCRSLVDHTFASVEFSRKCHEMLAVFGGKIPHQHGLVPGGVTVLPSSDRRIQFSSLLDQVRDFLERVMLTDAGLIAETFPEYFNIGTRPMRFLSYGLFDPKFGGHFPAGIWNEGRTEPVNPAAIREFIAFSWYHANDAHEIVPDRQKTAAYSWVKAPRYNGLALEGGPLARKILRNGVHGVHAAGTMDRLLARAEEAYTISGWMAEWVKNLPDKGSYVTTEPQRTSDETIHINDAPRGPLLHAMAVRDGEITYYDIITPTTWNFSPKDDQGYPGPAEEALIGTGVGNPEYPVEIGRIIRAFDPCLTCGTHLLDSSGRKLMELNIQG